jgi:hypothetical protein
MAMDATARQTSADTETAQVAEQIGADTETAAFQGVSADVSDPVSSGAQSECAAIEQSRTDPEVVVVNGCDATYDQALTTADETDMMSQKRRSNLESRHGTDTGNTEIRQMTMGCRERRRQRRALIASAGLLTSTSKCDSSGGQGGVVDNKERATNSDGRSDVEGTPDCTSDMTVDAPRVHDSANQEQCDGVDAERQKLCSAANDEKAVHVAKMTECNQQELKSRSTECGLVQTPNCRERRKLKRKELFQAAMDNAARITAQGGQSTQGGDKQGSTVAGNESRPADQRNGSSAVGGRSVFALHEDRQGPEINGASLRCPCVIEFGFDSA